MKHSNFLSREGHVAKEQTRTIRVITTVSTVNKCLFMFILLIEKPCSQLNFITSSHPNRKQSICQMSGLNYEVDIKGVFLINWDFINIFSRNFHAPTGGRYLIREPNYRNLIVFLFEGFFLQNLLGVNIKNEMLFNGEGSQVRLISLAKL